MWQNAVYRSQYSLQELIVYHIYSCYTFDIRSAISSNIYMILYYN